MNGKFENIPLKGNQNSRSYDVSVVSLPNGNLVYSASNMLKLIDENLKIIKSIDVRGVSRLASNRKNQVYFSCYQEECVFLLDINLNQVKIVGDQPDRSGEYLLEYPCGLCCYEDYLYVCDNRINKIHVIRYNITIRRRTMVRICVLIEN